MPERFSASVAGQHMACHASANLDLAIRGWEPPVEDRTKDNAANRGTAKHEMLEPLVKLSPGDLRHMIKFLTYVSGVRDLRRFNVLVEQSMTAEWLDTKPKTTADYVFYTQDEIHVLDGKWGRIKVDVVENHQLMFYGVTYSHLAPKAKGVHLHILQPYADNYDTWFADTNRLAQFMADARAAEAAIQAGSTTFQPGDHCTFCPANPHSRGDKGHPLCPSMMQLLGYGFRDVDEDELLAL